METDEAELVEIDENLVRADLSPAERALQIGRRQELYEKKHGKAKALGGHASQAAQGHKANANLADAFTKDATKKTRQSERSVQRDATRAKKVAVLPDIAGTSLDKGAEIDVLAKLPVEKQRSLAEAATGPGGSNSCTRTPSAAHPRLWRRAADLAGAQGVRGTDRQRTGGGGCRSIPKNATVPAGLAFYRESRH